LQGSDEEAVIQPALAQLASEKRHPHQRRIRHESLKVIEIRGDNNANIAGLDQFSDGVVSVCRNFLPFGILFFRRLKECQKELLSFGGLRRKVLKEVAIARCSIKVFPTPSLLIEGTSLMFALKLFGTLPAACAYRGSGRP
jgi:hypothetical protein